MPDLKPEQIAKLTAVIETNQGVIKFKFFDNDAPGHCNNFIKLASQGFYNGLIFHRVIQGFMIQGGCPQGSGTGGPGWQIKAEFNKHPHVDGTVSMARSQDPDSAGSQFFICDGTQSFLNGKYTAFGQVSEGLDVVHAIAAVKTGGADRPAEKQIMTKVYIEGL
jgi:peptidyl-prolyl cis-trans isomerase B (cyclophilin B)